MGKVEVNRSEIAQETSTMVVEAGLYRHPNGTEAITLYDPLTGNAQAEAFVRLGFEFVRPAKADEIKTIVETARTDATVTQASELQSTVDKLELESLRRKVAELEADKTSGEDDAAKKAAEEQAKAEAEAKAKEEADAKAAAEKAEADKKAAEEKAKADAAKKAAEEKGNK